MKIPNLLIPICPQVGFSKMRGLAFDGRCETFDASADGFARGEGIGSSVDHPRKWREDRGERTGLAAAAAAVVTWGKHGETPVTRKWWFQDQKWWLLNQNILKPTGYLSTREYQYIYIYQMLTIANPPKPWFGWRSLDLSRSKPGVGKNWVNKWRSLWMNLSIYIYVCIIIYIYIYYIIIHIYNYTYIYI